MENDNGHDPEPGLISNELTITCDGCGNKLRALLSRHADPAPEVPLLLRENGWVAVDDGHLCYDCTVKKLAAPVEGGASPFEGTCSVCGKAERSCVKIPDISLSRPFLDVCVVCVALADDIGQLVPGFCAMPVSMLALVSRAVWLMKEHIDETIARRIKYGALLKETDMRAEGGTKGEGS